eukprot:6019507-Pleurochrysis_carterae.AAC.2
MDEASALSRPHLRISRRLVQRAPGAALLREQRRAQPADATHVCTRADGEKQRSEAARPAPHVCHRWAGTSLRKQTGENGVDLGW